MQFLPIKFGIGFKMYYLCIVKIERHHGACGQRARSGSAHPTERLGSLCAKAPQHGRTRSAARKEPLPKEDKREKHQSLVINI